MSEDRQVLPLLQRIRSLGIDIDNLLPFSLAVNEKAQKYNLSISAAAYQLIEEIENYIRIGGLNKEISKLAAQIYAMNQICAPKKQSNCILAKASELWNYRR